MKQSISSKLFLENKARVSKEQSDNRKAIKESLLKKKMTNTNKILRYR